MVTAPRPKSPSTRICEYKGAIELPPTAEYEAMLGCFSGRDLDELHARREVLRATREAILGQ